MRNSERRLSRPIQILTDALGNSLDWNQYAGANVEIIIELTDWSIRQFPEATSLKSQLVPQSPVLGFIAELSSSFSECLGLP
jgi:hypothetical protein